MKLNRTAATLTGLATATALIITAAPAEADTERVLDEAIKELRQEPTSSRDRVKCRFVSAGEMDVVRSPVTLYPYNPTGQRLEVRARTWYKACLNKRTNRAWVWTKAQQGSVHVQDGENMSCRYFSGATFNFYLWSVSGQNLNPGPFLVGCDGNSSWNIEARKLARERLNRVAGNWPRMKVNIEAHYRLTGNDHRTLYDKLSWRRDAGLRESRGRVPA